MLLGAGGDGHTASLFPGDAALREQERWVTAVTAPRIIPQVPRITVTLPVINTADCVIMLVSGAGKKNIVQSILDNTATAQDNYPAAMVKPRGQLIWMIDELC
jgi:6-phosphogluconolactonase